MVLSEIIKTGLDNPECSFFVGSFVGIGIGIKLVVVASLIGLVFKAIDKLAWEPLIYWIKKKMKSK